MMMIMVVAIGSMLLETRKGNGVMSMWNMILDGLYGDWAWDDPTTKS